nr:putative type VI secretion system effector [Xanthomonas oryzae]
MDASSFRTNSVSHLWCVVQRFLSASDQGGMAATGAVAAALGLSGAAAGMVAMSMEEMKEPVSKVSFDVGGRHVEALLWNWPFKEGDEVQVVAEPTKGGVYIGFAVLDPKEKIIVLYPHVSAGGRAHWKNVFKISSMVTSVIIFLMLAFMVVAYTFSKEMAASTLDRNTNGCEVIQAT